MENEDPAITFDRVAGESAMVRQLLGLLLANSPGALASLRALDPEVARAQMEGRAVSDVFIEQAMDALADITRHAEAAAPSKG